MIQRAGDSPNSWSDSKPKPARAAVACKACNARKIRCSYVISGSPCTNCAADGVPCEVAKRKRRANPYQLPSNESSPRQTAVVQNPQQNLSQPETADSSLGYVNAPPQLGSRPGSSNPDHGRNIIHNSAEMRNAWNSPLIGSASSSSSHSDLHPITYDVASETFREPSLAVNQFERSENSISRGTISTERNNLYYLGDDRGPRGFILNLLQGRGDESRHIALPMPVKTLMPTENQNLEQREALSLPPAKVQDALVLCYFHYVHPFAPILDGDDFLALYRAGNMSLLLLWSVFTAAGNFIDEKVISGEFGLSRMAFKQAMFQRAKALYDLEYEKDTICLIQSVYLMTYWVGDVHELTGSWHWLGIAINLAYGLGLHHLSSYRSRQHEAPVSLLQRIWWCIHCREVWLSIGYGRPMRIHLDDVNTAPPTETETEFSSAAPGIGLMQSYLTEDIKSVSKVWICLVRLTVVLAKILSTSYTAQASRLTADQLEQMEGDIHRCIQGLPDDNQKSHILKIHILQIRLYHEATIVVLYRPSIILKEPKPSSDGQILLEQIYCRKMRSAALRATHLVNILMADEYANNAHLFTIIAIVPPMQMHLFDLLSASSTTRSAGEHNLQLCMVFLHNLRGAHCPADATYKAFEAFIERTKQKQELQMTDELASFAAHASGQYLHGGLWRGSGDAFGFPSASTLFYNEIFPNAPEDLESQKWKIT